MTKERKRIGTSRIQILGSFKELDEKLEKKEISREEYDNIFSLSRVHGLCGDIHPFALGGSDSATVLGISPWNAPSDLLKEKMGYTEKKITDKTRYLFSRGHIYEGAIREAFSLISGLKTDEFPYQVVNDRWPHCVANIDGVVFEGDQMGILEIKSTDFGTGSYKAFFEYEEVPEYYFSQIQFYMQVLERDFAYIVCAKDFSKSGMKYYRIERDDEFGEELMSKMENFVDRVIKHIPIDDSIVSSEKLIKRKLIEYCGKGDPKKASIKLDKSLADVFRLYDSLDAEVQTLSSEVKEKNSDIAKKKRQMEGLKDKIAYELKDAVSGELIIGNEGWSITSPAVKGNDWGPGAKDYIRETYPEIFDDVALACPQKRKLSIVKIEKGEKNVS